jgi:hypothetical protein
LAFLRKEPFVYRFPVKVEKRGVSFVVIVPAVPGCVAWGRNSEEALQKAREMLQAILIQAGPVFSPAASAPPLPGHGTDGEYVELAVPAVQAC